MTVYVLGGLRTAIVTAGTKFKKIRPEVFGAEVLKALRRKFSLAHVDGHFKSGGTIGSADSFRKFNLTSDSSPLAHVDEIICGNAVGTGGNLARLMTLTAGFDEATAALTVDRQCASGAAAISIGYAKISCGLAEVIIAGGAESSSLQPLRVYNSNDERFNLTAVEVQGGYKTAQFSPDEFDALAMLRGAERVADAEKISRDEMDVWALRSHQRAAAAVENLREYIVDVAGVREDTGIKKNISRRLLERAPRPLGVGTKISAGNACRINDGAAFVVLASEKFVRENSLTPAAKILDVATCGVNPLESPRGAQVVADKLLTRNGLTYDELSAIEFNEAFAVIDVLFERSHPSCVDKFNPLGGALAYGHPYGASGAVLLIHLLASLKTSGGLGLLSIAGAGGTGEAILIEAMT